EWGRAGSDGGSQVSCLRIRKLPRSRKRLVRIPFPCYDLSEPSTAPRTPMLNPRLDGLAEALFREAGDALFLFEPETGQILEVNPTAQRLSGFSRAELLQMQTTSLLQAEGIEAQAQMRNAEQHTTFFHARDGFVLRTSQDNVWIPVNLTITRLHLGSQTLGLITARDVRDFREAY